MKEYFKELLEYSHYYNLEVIKKFKDGDLEFIVPKRAIQLLSHTLNAQKIWNDRIAGEKDQIDVWKDIKVEEMEQAENLNHEQSLRILASGNLDKIIRFQNSKGESFQNSVKDILFHMVNHATYHRGQIATEFRKQGIDPIVSDFVYYKFNRN